MSKKKTSDELYLDICAEFIENRFDKNPGIQRYPDTDRLYANFVTPEDGGKVCWFDTSDLSWVEADQNATSWCILPDGTVYVANPEDATGDADIQLKVRHPREVAELIHLFVQPSSRLLPKISESHCLKLGEAADLYALIPYGEGFRALDLKRLPADMPVDMLQPLALSLTHDGESLSRGDYSGPSWFATKWKDFVDSLPEAMPLIRDGYAFNKNCYFGDGMILLGGIHDIAGPFLFFLLVPSRDDVSSFYLAEYLNHDLAAYEQHKAALMEGNNLGIICTMLADLPVHLPADYTDQIRFAVQHNLLKQEVMNSARGLVGHRAQFDQQQSRYQAAVSALDQTLSELLNSSRNRQDTP
jgi:hypothetical protein